MRVWLAAVAVVFAPLACTGSQTPAQEARRSSVELSSLWYSLDRPGCPDCSGKGPAARAWAAAHTGASSTHPTPPPPPRDSAPGAADGAPANNVTAAPSGSPASGNLTAAQRNAVRSANSYLQLSGFSRQGLIDQLSSEFGDKYTVEQATYGVTQAGIC